MRDSGAGGGDGTVSLAPVLPLDEIRSQSLQTAAALGYPRPPPQFPLLDNDLMPRASPEVLHRLAALSAIAAVAHGCPPSAARKWLAVEGVIEVLSPSEREYLGQESHSAQRR